MKIARTIRGLDSDLLDEVNQIAFLEKRNQGEIINEGMMLWLKKHEQKKAKRKKK